MVRRESGSNKNYGDCRDGEKLQSSSRNNQNGPMTMCRHRRPFRSLLLALLAMGGVLCVRTPACAQLGRIEVLPVIFVPSDNKDVIAAGRIKMITDLLNRHLALARAHYRSVFETDTFKIADRKVVVFRAARPDAAYETQVSKGGAESAHIKLAELFAWMHEDRYSSRTVYLVIYARPATSGSPNLRAGGRTFNGRPNTGGGYIEIELSSLLSDDPSPFQSTLVHELGHAFGLQHVS